MSESLILLIVLLVLPVIVLFASAGCVGKDPELVAEAEEAKKEAAAAKDKAAAADKSAQDKADAAAAAAEAAKYENVVKAEANIVSFWRLDELETGDTTAKDSVKVAPLNGQYRFLQGISRGQAGALTFKDPNDKSAQFKGTQGFVEVPHDGLRNPPFAFSVECWLLPEGASTQPQVVIGSYEVDATGALVRGFVLDVLRAPTLRVRARLGNDVGATAIEASLGDGLQHSGWRHVVMTYDTPTHTLMLYVNADDGKADAQLPTPATPAPVGYAIVTDPATPLRMGAGLVEVAPAAPGAPAIASVGQYFEGRIDEVALYRVALDGATVKKHYQSA